MMDQEEHHRTCPVGRCEHIERERLEHAQYGTLAAVFEPFKAQANGGSMVCSTSFLAASAPSSRD
jgi:hypothetical protein